MVPQSLSNPLDCCRCIVCRRGLSKVHTLPVLSFNNHNRMKAHILVILLAEKYHTFKTYISHQILHLSQQYRVNKSAVPRNK